jgi:hypothetical protein
MTVESGRFAPTDEVDQIQWYRPAEAAAALSYSRDRDILSALTGRLDT